jgi:HEAT repeat protein
MAASWRVGAGLAWLALVAGPAGGDSPRHLGKSQEEWARRLKDPEPETSVGAVDALGLLGQKSGRFVPELAGALRDRDRLVLLHAARALAGIGPEARPAIPALIDALEVPADPKLGASALGDLAPLVARAIAWLPQAPPRPGEPTDEALRGEIVRALRSLGSTAVADLAAGLTHPSPVVRARLADLLATMTPDQQAAPALVAALADPVEGVRSSAASALRRLGKAAVPGLIAVLDGPDDRLGERAAEILSNLRAPGVAPARVASLRAQGGRARTAALLIRLDPGWAPEVAPILNGALRSPDEPTRHRAATLLAWLNPPSEETVPALTAALKDPSLRVRARSAEALSCLAVLPTEALIVAPLIEALSAPEMRPWALKALARVGPRAVSAVPALVRMLADSDPVVRGEAATALAAVGPRPRARRRPWSRACATVMRASSRPRARR